ncbi:MAG: phosphatidylglycerophosphatase A family protein [Opitutaceae bacterium]
MRLGQPVWTRFLPSRAAIGIATLGPVGRLPAPGTWGSVAGWLYFVVVFLRFDDSGSGLAVATVLLTIAGGYLAVALCGEAEFRLGVRDPGEVILDEFVAMPLCFLGWSGLLAGLPGSPHLGALALAPLLVSAAGFLVFRLFDVTKPFGIARLQDLPGGWGIVADDLAAALAACIVLHGAEWIWAAMR